MRRYTETETFKAEFSKLKAAGIDESSLTKYKKIMDQFDENRCEWGTDYSKVVLAYPHPIP